MFYPVLLFAGAAKVATPGTFRELYFLLPLPVAQIAVGLAVAWLVLGHAVWWRGQPDGVAPHALGRFRRVAMVAVGFPNAVEIPLAILTALTDEWRVGEFADETREESIERGSGYLSVYSVCYNLVLWTTLFDYFVRTGEGEPAPEPGAVVAAPKFGKPVAPPVMDGPRMVAGEEEDDEAPTTPLGRRKSPSAGALETSSSSSSVQVAGAAATATTTTVAEPPGVSARVWEYARRLARLPPLMATVAGVLVGLCAPVRGLLFGGELEWALDILRVIAGGTVPLSMLVVGSSLYRGLAASRDAPTTAAPDADAVTRPRATTRVLVGVAVARLVVAAGVTGALFTVLLSSAGALDLSNKLYVPFPAHRACLSTPNTLPSRRPASCL